MFFEPGEVASWPISLDSHVKSHGFVMNCDADTGCRAAMVAARACGFGKRRRGPLCDGAAQVPQLFGGPLPLRERD